MAEAPADRNNQGFAGRLARTRLAIWVTMVVERGWPLILPLAVVGSLFVSLAFSVPGAAPDRILPAAAGDRHTLYIWRM